MLRTNLLACDEADNLLVTADGKTLLVFTGDDEQPLWKGECEGAILGVGVTDEEVITLDDTGLLVWWDGETGERGDEVAVEGSPKAFAVDRDGVAAVLTDEGVEVIDPGDEPRSIELGGGRSIAWAAAAGRFAVGGRDGTIRIFDEEDLEEVGSAQLPGPVVAVLGIVGGDWLVSAGAALHVVAADGEVVSAVAEVAGSGEARAKPDCLAGSADGQFVACRAAPDRVLAFDRETGQQVASVVYADRTVAGVAFGAKSWLGVALDGGDANRVSLRTGAVRHTAAHEGRSQREAAPAVDVAKLERRPRARRAPVPTPQVKAPRPKGARLETEVPVPDRQTLGMLGVIALSTVVMWGAAKFACNAHPPESKKPREVGTVELASTPKDAAIEMVHRLASLEFDRALELADTEPAQEVERQLRACESAGKEACDAKREQAAGKVLTTAEVLSSSGNSAKARVTTTGPEGTRVYAVDLVNSPPIWKVTRLKLE